MPAAGPDASTAPQDRSDIRSDHWTLRISPAAARPYLRLIRIDRPIGTWLLLFPCWWSAALVASAGMALPDWRHLLLFAVGAFIMRSAGCTFNDLADRDIDAKVARTATRPIPSGQVTPRRAGLFLALLLLAGLLVLLQFNGFTIVLGLSSLALVFSYPFMKRITYWPQAWLGLTFNWGALMGWAAASGALDWPPVLLYAAGVAWTLGYDTIYAHQDKEDDALVGVKSTALKLGRATKAWLVVFYGLALALMAAAGHGLGWPLWLGLGAVAVQFAWQIVTLDIDDPLDCQSKFMSNRLVGWLLLLGLVAAGQIEGI